MWCVCVVRVVIQNMQYWGGGGSTIQCTCIGEGGVRLYLYFHSSELVPSPRTRYHWAASMVGCAHSSPIQGGVGVREE